MLVVLLFHQQPSQILHRLYCDEEGKNPVTQFDKNDVEDAGLVKFDFLRFTYLNHFTVGH